MKWTKYWKVQLQSTFSKDFMFPKHVVWMIERFQIFGLIRWEFRTIYVSFCVIHHSKGIRAWSNSMKKAIITKLQAHVPNVRLQSNSNIHDFISLPNPVSLYEGRRKISNHIDSIWQQQWNDPTKATILRKWSHLLAGNWNSHEWTEGEEI